MGIPRCGITYRSNDAWRRWSTRISKISSNLANMTTLAHTFPEIHDQSGTKHVAANVTRKGKDITYPGIQVSKSINSMERQWARMKDKKINTYSTTVTAQDHFEGSSVLHFCDFSSSWSVGEILLLALTRRLWAEMGWKWTLKLERTDNQFNAVIGVCGASS